MNRDERRTRAPGTPPLRRDSAGVALLAPLDREAGGSWIAVNEHGLSLALLNRYEETPHDGGAGYVSRGLLLLELAPLPSPDALTTALQSRELLRYRPFTLACVGPMPSAVLFEWNGSTLNSARIESGGLLAASSGADQLGAAHARAAVCAAAAGQPGGLRPAVLADLHRSHQPERGPLSICMHREEAVTVSSALITVSPDGIQFRQVEGSPCEGGPVTELSLSFRAEPVR